MEIPILNVLIGSLKNMKAFCKVFVVPWREEALFFTIFFPAGKAFSKLQKHDQPIKKPFYVTGLFLYPWEHEKTGFFLKFSGVMEIDQ